MIIAVPRTPLPGPANCSNVCTHNLTKDRHGQWSLLDKPDISDLSLLASPQSSVGWDCWDRTDAVDRAQAWFPQHNCLEIREGSSTPDHAIGKHSCPWVTGIGAQPKIL